MLPIIAFTILAVAPQTKAIPIETIISTPTAFEGKTIRIVAYMHLEFEGNALYPSKTECDNSQRKNGLWIDIYGPCRDSAIVLNNKMVVVEGKFSSKDRGHLSLWAGSISSIRNIKEHVR